MNHLPAIRPAPSPGRAAAAVALGLLLPLLGACAGPAAQRPGAQAFEQRRYDQALREAEAAAGSPASPSNPQAALIAGMAAHAAGKADVAQTWLVPLTKSSDRGVAGRANLTLGQIALDRGRNVDAVGHLTSASESLGGDDAARAAMQAGDAYRRLKMNDEAKAQYDTAARLAQDEPLRKIIAERQAGRAGPPAPAGAPVVANPNAANPNGPFTIQFGAYGDGVKAQRQAAAVRATAAKAGAPGPRIVPTRSQDGRSLYAVRVGLYSTRAEAQRVLARLGSPAGVAGVVMAASN